MVITYSDMIVDCILTLKERKGASRVAIWKCMQAKYPESDYKQFLIRLKKLGQDGKEVTRDGQRFRVNPSLK